MIFPQSLRSDPSTDILFKFHLTLRFHLSYIFIIYLPRVLLSVCVCVCVSQLRNAQALLFVLVIKLTKETRRRGWRGRDRDGEIGKEQIGEGGCEETLHCWSQTWETCRFTVPPAVALFNYISSGILWRILSQTEIFAGFSLYMYYSPEGSAKLRWSGKGSWDIIW